jgi:hypothetical protein
MLAVADGLVEQPRHAVVAEGADRGLAVQGPLKAQAAEHAELAGDRRRLPAAGAEIAAAVSGVHAMPAAK